MQTLDGQLKALVAVIMLTLWQELSMLKRKKTGMAVKPKITSQITASAYVRIINWKREISRSCNSDNKHKQTSFERHKFRTYTYCQADTAPKLGAPVFSKGLFYRTGGVKTFSQQQQTIQEEEGGQTVDHILKVFYTETHNTEEWRKCTQNNRSQLTEWNHLQIGQHWEILDLVCKVQFYQSTCVRERLMACPTEECHPGIAEQGGQEGGVGHSAQAADAGVIATCGWVIYEHTCCAYCTHNAHTHLYTMHTLTSIPDSVNCVQTYRGDTSTHTWLKSYLVLKCTCTHIQMLYK